MLLQRKENAKPNANDARSVELAPQKAEFWSKGTAVSGAARFDAGIYAEETAVQGPRRVATTSGERLYSVFRGTDPTPIGVWTAAELRAYRAGEEATQAFGQVCQAADKATRKAVKAGLLRYAPAGVFPYRNKNSITAYTGEVVLDVDAPVEWLAPRIPVIVESLRACPHITDVSYSAGGRLHIRLRTGAAHSGEHARAYHAARAAVVLLRPEIGPYIDHAGATLSQVFICAAPCIWFNDAAPPLPLPAEPEPARRRKRGEQAQPDFARAVVSALRDCARQSPDVFAQVWDVSDRRAWIGAAFAFADAIRLGVAEADAFDAFDAASATAHNYDGNTAAVWRDAIKGDQRPDGAGFGTLAFMARKLGFRARRPQRKHETPETIRRAIYGNLEPETLQLQTRYITGDARDADAFFAWLDAVPEGAVANVCAPTGAGKTAAILQWALQRDPADGPVLYAVPSAMQRDEMQRQYAGSGALATLSAADDTPRKQQEAGAYDARVVFGTNDAIAMYEGPCPAVLVVDEIHDLPAAHGYRTQAVRGLQRVAATVLSAGGRVVAVSATPPPGLARTLGLRRALQIQLPHAPRVILDFHTWEGGEGPDGQTYRARPNLSLIARRIADRIAAGDTVGLLMNAGPCLREIKKELKRLGHDARIIAADATGEDAKACEALVNNGGKLPDGVRCLLCTSRISTGFNIKDDRPVSVFVIDNGMTQAVGRLAPELVAQFWARFRDKSEISIEWHTIPDPSARGKAWHRPAFDEAYAAQCTHAQRWADAANAQRKGEPGAELLPTPMSLPVAVYNGQYGQDAAGVWGRALADYNRGRSIADIVATLKVHVPDLAVSKTRHVAGPDPLYEAVLASQKTRLRALKAVAQWAAGAEQADARALAFFCMERAGRRGRRAYGRIFKHERPNAEDLRNIAGLAVALADEPNAETAPLGEILDPQTAIAILRAIAGAAKAVQFGGNWRKQLPKWAGLRTTAIGRWRARMKCAICLTGDRADGAADGLAAAQLREAERCADLIVQTFGTGALVSNKQAAQIINANGGWMGQFLSPRMVREELAKFLHLEDAGRKRIRNPDTGISERRRVFIIKARARLEDFCQALELKKADFEDAADELRKLAAGVANARRALWDRWRAQLANGVKTIQDVAKAAGDALRPEQERPRVLSAWAGVIPQKPYPPPG